MLAVQCSDKTDAENCAFCEKPGHALHKCRSFKEKNKAERIKFVQINKLCFGYLKSGHRSKNCDDRSTCEIC